MDPCFNNFVEFFISYLSTLFAYIIGTIKLALGDGEYLNIYQVLPKKQQAISDDNTFLQHANMKVEENIQGNNKKQTCKENG